MPDSTPVGAARTLAPVTLGTQPPLLIRVRPQAAAGILDALRVARTSEPCGYLLGRRVGDSAWRIEEAVAGTNVHPSPLSGFRLDASEQLAARRAARADGRRVVGIWHGHLLGPPTPGRADEVGLQASGLDVMLIAGRVSRGGIALRAYAAVDGALRPSRLVRAVSAPDPQALP